MRKYYLLPLFLLPPIGLAILAAHLFPEQKPLLASKDFAREDRPLLTTPDSWTSSANILLVNGDKRFLDPWLLVTDKADPLYWAAVPLQGDGSARLASRPFRAPRWVSLVVTGDLTRPGNEVYFRPVGEDKRVRVRVHTDASYWRRVTLALPAEWEEKPVVMVAEAGPRKDLDWFGWSSPRALGPGTVLASQMKTLAVLPAFAASLFLFLLPGLPAAALLAVRGRLEPALLVPAAVVFSCLAGYLTFWAYFLSPGLGRGFGWVVLLGGAAALAATLASGRAARDLLLSRETLTPVALTGLVGLFFLSLLYGVDLEVGIEGQPRIRFFEYSLAMHGEIPYHFADILYNHEDPREKFPARVPGWQSSDRPPLQAGLTLLQLPLIYRAGDRRLYAVVAGCAFQCAWVPAVWALWRLGGLPRRRAGLALLFVVLTGFALVNSVFTWPKLLAAALALFAVSLALFGREGGRPFPPARAGLLGLAAALGCLAHGGVAFTLLPLALLLLLPRYYPGRSGLAVAAAVFVAAMVPWMLYQSRFDPPGDRLVRAHLAGGSPTWQEGRPLWRNLLDAYGALGPGELVANKLANLRVLFTAARDQYGWPPHQTPAEWPVDASGYRRCEFLALFWSLGLLNLGWVVALMATRRPALQLDPALGVAVPALGLAAVLVWVLLMFGPGGTVVHQGSYATSLLLMVALAARLTALPPRLAYLLLALQSAAFAAGWVLTSPANGYGPINVFMAPLAAVFLVALAAVALGTASRQGP